MSARNEVAPHFLAEDVAKWLADAGRTWPKPTPAMCGPLVDFLNEVWSTYRGSPLPKAQKAPSKSVFLSKAECARYRRALEEARMSVIGNPLQQAFDQHLALLDEHESHITEPGEDEPWVKREVARLIAIFAMQAWRSAGVTGGSISKWSPLNSFVIQALGELAPDEQSSSTIERDLGDATFPTGKWLAYILGKESVSQKFSDFEEGRYEGWLWRRIPQNYSAKTR